ncbi:GyrI-like domain-containing protein [Bacillus licheniformis]|nr:GyrI-like domain-containing protein [Bacillus licheniformis]
MIGKALEVTVKDGQNKRIFRLLERIKSQRLYRFFKTAHRPAWLPWRLHGFNDQPDTFNFEKYRLHACRLCRKTIPAATWAVFEAIGPVNPAGQATWERIFSECFPATGYELANEPQFEAYPEDGDIMAQDHITEIWIPVVSRNNPERENG